MLPAGLSRRRHHGPVPQLPVGGPAGRGGGVHVCPGLEADHLVGGLVITWASNVLSWLGMIPPHDHLDRQRSLYWQEPFFDGSTCIVLLVILVLALLAAWA